MKVHYYKISLGLYFTMLTALLKEARSMDELQSKYLYGYLDEATRSFTERYSVILPPTLLDLDKIYTLVKCTGSALFNKHDEWYFASPKDLLPVYIYFIKLAKASGNSWNIPYLKNLEDTLSSELSKYHHEAFRNSFDIFSGDGYESFMATFRAMEKSFIQFITHYYQAEPKTVKKLVVIRKKNKEV